jgi:hypothetical protein
MDWIYFSGRDGRSLRLLVEMEEVNSPVAVSVGKDWTNFSGCDGKFFCSCLEKCICQIRTMDLLLKITLLVEVDDQI